MSEHIPSRLTLLERASGDAAFGELCQRYAPLIYRVVHDRHPDQATAEDLTSDVFHRALRAMDRYGSPTPFGSLLYRALAEVVADEPNLAESPSRAAELREALIDPAFQRRLAASLVAERGRRVAARRGRRRRPAKGRRRPRVRLGLAACAAVIALLLGARIWGPLSTAAPEPVTATAEVADLSSVVPWSTVTVGFSRPMDPATVVRALRINPATVVRTAWRGNRLLVRAVHGFTPNSPYILTISRSVARTASGASLAADLDVTFGTARAAPLPDSSGPPTALPLTTVASAEEGSRAVVTMTGAVVATAGRVQWGAQTFTGLISFRGAGFERLGPPAAAICVSQSGRALAYLSGSGAGTHIVIAGGDGSGARFLPARVDQGSPLGWVGDQEVSFVSGGHLEAVDRAGAVRRLGADQIDAARDTIVISPGGRYVFLRTAGAGTTPGRGRLLDLPEHSARDLTGIEGTPAFSKDGDTVVWVDGSGPFPRLDSGPSDAGPVLSVPLPLAAGDRVSDLAVAPDGGRVAYSVKHADGSGELRIADLGDGATLASSGAGTGQSPSWSPTDQSLVFLAHPGGRPEIRVAVTGPPAGAAVQGSITSFANAQITRDAGGLRALSDPGVPVDDLPDPSRVVVVQVAPVGKDAWRASLRLLVDPSPADPVARWADEMLRLRRDGGSGRIVVANASATTLADLPPGPHVVGVGAGPRPGTVALIFDADLDPSTVPAATIVRSGDRPLRALVAYDAATRTVVVTVAGGVGPMTLLETTSLRDVAGQSLSAPFRTSVTG